MLVSDPPIDFSSTCCVSSTLALSVKLFQLWMSLRTKFLLVNSAIESTYTTISLIDCFTLLHCSDCLSLTWSNTTALLQLPLTDWPDPVLLTDWYHTVALFHLLGSHYWTLINTSLVLLSLVCLLLLQLAFELLLVAFLVSHTCCAVLSSVSSQPLTMPGYGANFVSELLKRHECPICLQAMRNPVQTECGHLFCKDCLEPILRKRRPMCPIDQEDLSREGVSAQ